jgi:threonine-phosphate decarboxylase
VETARVTAHGGDIWQACEELGTPARELLDFSANINPRGLPAGARARLTREAADAGLIGAYPDTEARELRRALSERLGAPVEAIVIGPGAEALLSPILRCTGARRVLVPTPAFSEYRRVCGQEEIEYVPFPLARAVLFRVDVERLCSTIEEAAPGAVILNNPHNPTGALLCAGEVRCVLESARAAGATVILDEAFIDYAPEESLTGEAARQEGLIAIRSLTKFYGCPALRIGYAVAHPDAVRRIRAGLPTWPVTQLAMDALAEALADDEYAEESRRENAREREGLAEALRGLGLFVFPSAANYLLAELREDMPTAGELRARLSAKHRILIRNCDSYEGVAPGRYVRVAVRSGSENLRLVEALAAELRGR